MQGLQPLKSVHRKRKKGKLQAVPFIPYVIVSYDVLCACVSLLRPSSKETARLKTRTIRVRARKHHLSPL